MLSLLEKAQMRFPERAGFKVTQVLIDDLKKELTTPNSNPVKIASRYGVPVSLVRYLSNELPSATTRYPTASEDGWGRAELRDFIITRKVAGQDWSKEDQAKIDEARNDYDDGKCEMCQGRDGDFIILYSITRRKPITRYYPYFRFELEHDEG